MTTAIVTGASRGIGRATALALARRGLDLALIGRPSDAMFDSLAAISAVAPRSKLFEADLADPGATERATRDAVETFGAPRAVVHAAAVIHRAAVVDLEAPKFDEQVAVNLRAPFVITRVVLPSMQKARTGRLVYLGSISSVTGTARSAAYNATKWGIVGFVKSLAEELTDSGVTAVAVLPGSVDTRMLVGSGFAPRMTADDVATTVVFAALDAPTAHNGGVLEMFGT